MQQVQAQLNALLMALRRSLADQSVAVFIDPTLGDPLEFDTELKNQYEQSIQQGKVRRIKLPVIHSNFDPDKHPYVLYAQSEEHVESLITATLRMALQESLELQVERKAARTLCGWITDPGNNAQALVNRLSTAAKIIKPDGLAWYLRYWDPRVIWQLPRLLDHAHWWQIQQSWGTWWSLGVDQTLARFSADAEQIVAHTPINAADATRQIPQPLWHRLQLVGTVNKVLSMMIDWGMKPDTAAARQVEQLLLTSEKYGFSSERDSLVFATCGLTSNPCFYEHPQVARVMQQAHQTAMTLSDALAPFDDEFWKQLKTWSPTDGRSLPRSE